LLKSILAAFGGSFFFSLAGRARREVLVFTALVFWFT